MSKKFLTSIDLNTNQLLNALIQVLGSDPSGMTAASAGRIWFNSTSSTMRHYDGAAVQNLTNLLESVATGTHLSVSTTNKQATVSVDATNLNTASTIVARDASGNFSAGTITAALTGTASTATTLNATANVPMNSFRITGLADPVSPQDGATKNYVDNVVQGLDVHGSVRATTTAALATNVYSNGSSGVGATLTASANGALAAQDGISLAVNDRLLVKNEATAANNGVYTVTQLGDGTHPYILTRATDANSSSNVTSGFFAFVEQGTANGATGWILTTQGTITIGSTAQTFSQFSGGGSSYTAGNGINIAGNVIAVTGTTNRIAVSGAGVDIASTYVGQTSITTLGTIATGTWNGTAIAVANGGTGATTAAGGRTALAATGKYAQTLSTTGTSFTVTHSLGTTDAQVQVVDILASPNAVVTTDVQIQDANNVIVGFASSVTANQYRVTVIG